VAKDAIEALTVVGPRSSRTRASTMTRSTSTRSPKRGTCWAPILAPAIDMVIAAAATTEPPPRVPDSQLTQSPRLEAVCVHGRGMNVVARLGSQPAGSPASLGGTLPT
jgi:hypothetical protein